MSKSSKRRKRRELEKAALRILQKPRHSSQLEPGAETENHRNQNDRPIVHAKRRHWLMSWVYHPWKLVWWSLGSLVVVLSLISYWPHITIEPSVSIDPKKPLKMNFTLQNGGVLPIHDVHGIAIWDFPKPVTLQHSTFIDLHTGVKSSLTGFFMNPGFFRVADKIEMNEKFDFSVDFPSAFIGADGEKSYETYHGTNTISVFISCSYTPKFWRKPKISNFRFTAIADDQNNFQWLHEGAEFQIPTNIPNL